MPPPTCGSSVTPRPAARVQDDVLRIEAEEPVFYIGPDTRPPRNANAGGIRQRIRANLDALRRPGPVPVRNRPAPSPGRPRTAGVVRNVNYVRAPAQEPPRQQPAPPEPPAEPSGRVRLAELTSSMLWATPLLALLMVPALRSWESMSRQTHSSLRTSSAWHSWAPGRP